MTDTGIKIATHRHALQMLTGLACSRIVQFYAKRMAVLPLGNPFQRKAFTAAGIKQIYLRILGKYQCLR